MIHPSIAYSPHQDYNQYQNYYQSPIIQNPPAYNTSNAGIANYGIADPYANYGQQYNQNYQNYPQYGYSQPGHNHQGYGQYGYGQYGYGQQGYGGCGGCNQSYPSYNYGNYGSYGGYGAYGGYGGYGGYGCSGCSGYGGQYPYYNYSQPGYKKDCGCGCGGSGDCGQKQGHSHSGPSKKDCGCGCGGKGGCGQKQGHNHYGPSKKDCGCGCGGRGDCGQYGYQINRDRITPNFPSKLRHSYITSGDQVQNKLVINEPVESAPFQSQRRKTYQPFTRKYIDYQDHIQYIPVQKSQWDYKKVMKQIDFVPQQYYVSEMQYIPRQRVDQKVRYLPYEQKIVHFPEQKLKRPDQRSYIRPTSDSHRPIFPSGSGGPGQRISTLAVPVSQQSQSLNRSGLVTINNHVVNRSTSSTVRPSIMRPAESTFQMVPNSRLHPIQQSGSFGSVSSNQYKFPQNGGVMIGSSSQVQNFNPALSSFGPGGGIENRQTQTRQSDVIQSVFNQFNQESSSPSKIQQSKFGQRKDSQNPKRRSQIESQSFDFDEFKKKKDLRHSYEQQQQNWQYK